MRDSVMINYFDPIYLSVIRNTGTSNHIATQTDNIISLRPRSFKPIILELSLLSKSHDATALLIFSDCKQTAGIISTCQNTVSEGVCRQDNYSHNRLKLSKTELLL